MVQYFCSLSVSLFTRLIQTLWDSGAYVMIFLWNLNPSLRHKNAVNFAMKVLNTSLVSMAYKTIVINITELYVFYDNMSQMSGLMHTFLPYFPTISVSICPLMIYFFLLLPFFLLSVLDSSRIEIGLTRYPSMLNLSLQGLCANNPSSFCWRKSVAPMSFFCHTVCDRLLQHRCVEVFLRVQFRKSSPYN